MGGEVREDGRRGEEGSGALFLAQVCYSNPSTTDGHNRFLWRPLQLLCLLLFYPSL